MVIPAARSSATKFGYRCARLPTTKNVARILCCAKIPSIACVSPGFGPSSNVNHTVPRDGAEGGGGGAVGRGCGLVVAGGRVAGGRVG